MSLSLSSHSLSLSVFYWLEGSHWSFQTQEQGITQECECQKVGTVGGEFMACLPYLDSSKFYSSDVGRMEIPHLAHGPHSQLQVLGPSLSSIPSPYSLSSIPHLNRLHVHICRSCRQLTLCSSIQPPPLSQLAVLGVYIHWQ